MKQLKKNITNGLMVLGLAFGLVTPVWSALSDADAKMIKWAERQAANGDVDTQVNLATLYYSGTLVDKDYVKAFDLYKRAAEKGNVDAQGNVGNMYFYGQGVKQDRFKAFEWYKKAAEQGSPGAQGMVGLLYLNGEAVRQDKFKAKSWLGKSCDNGIQLSCDKYRELNEQGY